MPYTPEEYALLHQQHLKLFAPTLGEPVSGYGRNQIEGLKNVLEMLPQYDEYYSINDLRELKFDWCFGVERVLGYESKTWTHYDSLRVIHDDYRHLYVTFGSIAYRLLTNEKPMLPSSLKLPYIINVPMQNKSGKYLWIKQMTMSINLDQQGMMVKQFNGYTTISPYEDVFLPLCPRLFLEDGRESDYIKKRMIELLIELGKVKFTAIQKAILKAYFNLDQGKSQEKESKRKGKQRIAITGKDVIDSLGLDLTPQMLKKQSQIMLRTMKEIYGVTFPNIYHLAMFLKPLFYEVNQIETSY